MVKKAKIVDYI